MKKNGLYSSLLLSAFLLAACNSQSNEIIETSASPGLPTNEVQPPEVVEQTLPVEQAPAIEQTPSIEQTPVEVPIVQPEQQAVTEPPQVAKTEPQASFITATSSTLNYTIQHVDGYTLAEEEPGKDMLFYNDNEALSMRIEVVPTTDGSFDSLHTLTQQSLASIAPNNTYEAFDLAPYLASSQRADVKNAAGYIVKYESDKVIAIVYEIEGKVIVLTIFDDYITGITDTFIKAGLTIH